MASIAVSGLTPSAGQQDGGKAATAKMEPSRQSVDEVKRVVETARKKGGPTAAPVRDFNEEDHYMDGARIVLPGPWSLGPDGSRLWSTGWEGNLGSGRRLGGSA